MENPSLGPWTDRKTLGHWAGQKVAKNEIHEYQLMNNTYSHDALPGLKSARKMKFRNNMVIVKGDEALFWVKRIVKGEWRGVIMGLLLGVLMGLVMGLMVSAGGTGKGWEGVIGRVEEVREMMGNLTGKNHLEVEL